VPGLHVTVNGVPGIAQLVPVHGVSVALHVTDEVVQVYAPGAFNE